MLHENRGKYDNVFSLNWALSPPQMSPIKSTLEQNQKQKWTPTSSKVWLTRDFRQQGVTGSLQESLQTKQPNKHWWDHQWLFRTRCNKKCLLPINGKNATWIKGYRYIANFFQYLQWLQKTPSNKAWLIFNIIYQLIFVVILS